MSTAARPKIVPPIYPLLSVWRYVEESLLRVIAGWGRCAGDWEDKLAVCHHVWLQAETVEAMRKRLLMYPGGKADPRVHPVYQRLMDAVIAAPSWPDAMAAVHQLIQPALVGAYNVYMQRAHPVHDLPTLEMITRIFTEKRKQQQWYESFSKRHPHAVNLAYAGRIRAVLAEVAHLQRAIEPEPPYAQPCGKCTDSRMPITPGRVKDWDKAPSIMPLVELDWSRRVEARRLFFMIGYCWEMGVAEQQLRWIYHADFMPWEFVYAEARHMWDESRHGDSGYTRLRDFGLDFEHVGYSSYGASGDGMLEPMTPREVYEAFYGVTQIAETGYFETKRYCFDDFLAGGDEASAEMMQFDIIDETSHVEYGRLWLDEMARRAGVDEDYRARGAKDRAKARAGSDGRVALYRDALSGGAAGVTVGPADHGGNSVNPTAAIDLSPLFDTRAREHYEWLLSEIRGQQPLRNSTDAPVRPNLPM